MLEESEPKRMSLELVELKMVLQLSLVQSPRGS